MIKPTKKSDIQRIGRQRRNFSGYRSVIGNITERGQTQSFLARAIPYSSVDEISDQVFGDHRTALPARRLTGFESAGTPALA
jgi:hypothetical protein